jgi:hypothetical protein
MRAVYSIVVADRGYERGLADIAGCPLSAFVLVESARVFAHGAHTRSHLIEQGER